jgi:hypothetical protein
VTNGSRESQPSGLELLPDLPPRDFVPGGLTIAPQLAVREGDLGFWPALREVFAATRQPRGQVHQPADVLSKLPLLRVPNRGALLVPFDSSDPVGAVVLFQRPMTTVLRKPRDDEEELLARWADPLAGGVWRGPGGGCLPASVVFNRGFWHPCRVLAMCGGGLPGVFAALDPRLPSGTPTGVGRAGARKKVSGTNGTAAFAA